MAQGDMTESVKACDAELSANYPSVVKHMPVGDWSLDNLTDEAIPTALEAKELKGFHRDMNKCARGAIKRYIVSNEPYAINAMNNWFSSSDGVYEMLIRRQISWGDGMKALKQLGETFQAQAVSSSQQAAVVQSQVNANNAFASNMANQQFERQLGNGLALMNSGSGRRGVTCYGGSYALSCN
jgi:hypothetical protein